MCNIEVVFYDDGLVSQSHPHLTAREIENNVLCVCYRLSPIYRRWQIFACVCIVICQISAHRRMVLDSFWKKGEVAGTGHSPKLLLSCCSAFIVDDRDAVGCATPHNDDDPGNNKLYKCVDEPTNISRPD